MKSRKGTDICSLICGAPATTASLEVVKIIAAFMICSHHISSGSREEVRQFDDDIVTLSCLMFDFPLT